MSSNRSYQCLATYVNIVVPTAVSSEMVSVASAVVNTGV